MPQIPGGTVSLLPQGIFALLKSASEMLGLSIDVRLASSGHPSSPAHTAPCEECGRADPAAFANCALVSRPAAQPGAAGEDAPWICTSGCEVISIPIDSTHSQPLVLFAVRCADMPQDPHWGRERKMRFLRHLAGLVAEHLDLANSLRRTSTQFAHTRDELGLLCRIAEHAGGRDDLRQMARRILAHACTAVRADAAIAYMAERRFLEIAVRDAELEVIPSATRKWRVLAGLIADHLQETNRNFFIGSDRDLRAADPPMGGEARIIAVRLAADGEPRGVLCLVHGATGAVDKESEIRLLETVAERIGMAITNHDLVENLKDFQMATVKSLVSAIEAKDSYTSGHSERVHILSMLLGKTLELSADELDVLKWASILHDIGKIGMPESILNKPSRLTPEEYEIMKEHPERGYKVLAPIQQLSAASLGVRSHHEMVDGAGYPMGLRGEEIPRVARIISVADTYDALTSTRAYRRRRSPDGAFAVIDAVRGTQLDPEVVDALDCLIPFIREHEVMIQTGTLVQPPAGVDEGQAEAA